VGGGTGGGEEKDKTTGAAALQGAEGGAELNRVGFHKNRSDAKKGKLCETEMISEVVRNGLWKADISGQKKKYGSKQVNEHR